MRFGLFTFPALISACVTKYVPLHVAVAPEFRLSPDRTSGSHEISSTCSPCATVAVNIGTEGLVSKVA